MTHQTVPEGSRFVPAHVRESTTIDRVAEILDGLPDEVEVVPLDVFIKLVGSGKSRHERRFPQPSDPVDRNPY